MTPNPPQASFEAELEELLDEVYYSINYADSETIKNNQKKVYKAEILAAHQDSVRAIIGHDDREQSIHDNITPYCNNLKAEQRKRAGLKD